MATYQKKIDSAIRLLRNIPQDGPLELSYSGGKDSDVILQLAREAGIRFEAIYKNTTIDPPGTIKHCRDNGVTIKAPKIPFFGLISQMGTPDRFRRFCCQYLKEYKVYDRAIQGIRREESTKPWMPVPLWRNTSKPIYHYEHLPSTSSPGRNRGLYRGLLRLHADLAGMALPVHRPVRLPARPLPPALLLLQMYDLVDGNSLGHYPAPIHTPGPGLHRRALTPFDYTLRIVYIYS